MRSLIASLLWTVALVSAKMVVSEKENLDRKLAEVATQLEGERCGNFDNCTAGLECVQAGLAKRCVPQTGCLARELKAFEEELDSEGFKAEILKEAEVTEEDVVQAAADAQTDGKILQNGIIRKLIRAVSNRVEIFASFGQIVDRCSYEDATPTETIVLRQGPAPTVLVPEMPTVPRSMAPSESPSISPSAHPTLDPTRTIFAGFHIEAGVLVEASISVFWKVYDANDNQTIYAKGCAGVGPLIGGDLSFISIVAETPTEEDISCLSAQYGVDIGVGLNVGYDLGVCLLEEPPFLYNQVTFGGGLGLGASSFSMCNGIDTGFSVDIFGGGL